MPSADSRPEAAPRDFIQKDVNTFETVPQGLFDEEMAAGPGRGEGAGDVQMSGRAYERDGGAFEPSLKAVRHFHVPALCGCLAPVTAFVENHNIGDAEAAQVSEMAIAD